MKIVIDLQGAQSVSRFRGIGRYSLSLTKSIIRNNTRHHIIIVLNGMLSNSILPIREEFDGILPQENIRTWYSFSPTRESESGNEWRRDLAKEIYSEFLLTLKPDVILETSHFEGFIDDAVECPIYSDKNVLRTVVLYDLIPLLHKEIYLKSIKYDKFYMSRIDSLKQADQLLTISQSTSNEAIEYLDFSSSNVVNISASSDDAFFKYNVPELTKNNLLNKFGINKEFVLYSGASDERKNHTRLINAYSNLPNAIRHNHQLVIAGGLPERHKRMFVQEVKKSGLRSYDVVITNVVSDEELNALYNLCKVFVFPSWHEGFGLPALEAMRCGSAVIGSNISSIPEVIGYEPALFDPYDERAITDKLQDVLENESFRQEIIEYQNSHVTKFNWDSVGQKALQALETMYESQLECNDSDDDTKDISEIIESSLAIIPNKILTKENKVMLSHILSYIRDNNKFRQLFVDVSELVNNDHKTGIQRVTRSILNELIKTSFKNIKVIPVYATNANHGYYYAYEFLRSVGGQGYGDDDLIEYQAGDIFLGLDLQHGTTIAQEKQLELMNRDGVKIYFVVYDLLPIQFPQFWPQEHKVNQVHSKWIKTISRYNGAICISRTVANELSDWLMKNVNSTQKFDIKWFHLGADIYNSIPTTGMPTNSENELENIRARPSFLMVGTLEPRKAHNYVLDEFNKLWERGADCNLIIVGKKGWLSENITDQIESHKEFNKRLIWLESITDEYLEKIYSASSCLIAASYGEGFGLPLIEAAQKGLPVIARDIPVFHEVAGEYATYFSGESAEGLADTIESWLNQYNKKVHPRSDAIPWITWKESAEQLLSCIDVDISELTLNNKLK